MQKLSKYGVFSGPYFSVFGLNTEKYGPKKKNPYLDTFYSIILYLSQWNYFLAGSYMVYYIIALVNGVDLYVMMRLIHRWVYTWQFTVSKY